MYLLFCLCIVSGVLLILITNGTFENLKNKIKSKNSRTLNKDIKDENVDRIYFEHTHPLGTNTFAFQGNKRTSCGKLDF